MSKQRTIAGALLMAWLSTVSISTPAGAWSWRDDAAGQKRDQEARHWLTTQNICGVQLKADYLADLDSWIVTHFTTMADDYRQFLLGSVQRANADYLQNAKPEEIKKECAGRVEEASKAGVIADINAKPYQWAAMASQTAGTPTPSTTLPAAVSTPMAPTVPATSPKLSDFIGAWSDVTDACRSYKQRTEGPWFEIKEKSFTSEGGGLCKAPTYTLKGNSLTISTRCRAEEAGYEAYKETFTLHEGQLKSADRTFMRCTSANSGGKSTAPTQSERGALGGLIAIIGKPKSNAEAIAQNTIVMVSYAQMCGLGKRGSAYEKQNNRAIQGAIAAAYGDKGQQEIGRITTGVFKWLNTTESPADARNALCKMIDNSLAHLGF
ncbi:hypothetical protein V5G24_22085 [Xanthobacter sp. VTT E-85241]|uniref:hypothetical protein n=1 Tax=Roseixanthobacter finlandensis TaxID=3119922 RepID=UPI00372BB64E